MICPTKTGTQLRTEIAEANPEALLLEDFGHAIDYDQALIGMTERQPDRPVLAVYSKTKIFQLLAESFLEDAKADGLSPDEYDDAVLDTDVTEWYCFNVVCWLGPMTPVIIDDLE